MRSQQRVAVALRSVAQRLRQGRRLDRLIDLGKFVEVVARAMGQGDRNTVGRHPTNMATTSRKPLRSSGAFIAASPSIPLENAKLPLGKAESACCRIVSKSFKAGSR